MISKLRAFFILSFLLCIFAAQAKKLVVYNTYSDFTEKKGSQYEVEYWGNMHIGGKITLFFEDADKKNVKVKCKEVWGFEFDGKLYRNDPKRGNPYLVLNSKSICFYENGVAFIESTYKKESYTPTVVGFTNCFSENLNSEFVPAAGFMQSGTKAYKKFKEAHPEHKGVFACIASQQTREGSRNCMIDMQDLETESK